MVVQSTRTEHIKYEQSSDFGTRYNLIAIFLYKTSTNWSNIHDRKISLKNLND